MGPELHGCGGGALLSSELFAVDDDPGDDGDPRGRIPDRPEELILAACLGPVIPGRTRRKSGR